MSSFNQAIEHLGWTLTKEAFSWKPIVLNQIVLCETSGHTLTQ